MDIMDDDSVFKSPQKSFRIKRRILKEKQSNVTDNESLIKDLMPRDDDQELGSPFVDTVLKSPQRSFSLKRRVLKVKQGNSDSLLRDLFPQSDAKKKDDSSLILSRKGPSSTQKVNSYSKRRINLPQSSQENINMSIPGVSIDDSIANAPSKKKNTPITRRAIPSSNLPYETTFTITPRSISTSTRDFDDNLSFHPNVESTRLLNLTTPRRVSTPKLSSSSLNLSTKSLYNVKLRTHQIIEGGTQMSFRKEPEEDLNLSAKTVYNQKLTNKQVMEGGTQTSAMDELIVLPQIAEVQHESDDNDDAMEDPENMDVSNSSDSSAKSGFIPHLCLTQTEKVIVPITENDFNLSDGNTSFTTNNSSTNNRCDSPSQELTEKDSHQNEGTALDVSRHSNSGICGPNTSINNESPHENDTNVPTTPSFGIIRPFFDSSESESEDAETLVNNNHLHSEEETNHNTSQSKILTKFNPFTFKERYGTERNNRNETLMQVVEEGAPSRRKNHRKSIFAKNSRAGRIKMSESIVSFKEGFEYFSRFCPFELTKKAKEEFFKICEELISDILKRVSDEAFFDGGRTKVSLKDVKNVMIQYKCFPPTPKDVRYPNQHLYAFLIKNCDDQAAKLLIPPSSFELKKNEFPVDIWEDVDEEIPTTHRKRLRSQKK